MAYAPIRETRVVLTGECRAISVTTVTVQRAKASQGNLSCIYAEHQRMQTIIIPNASIALILYVSIVAVNLYYIIKHNCITIK